MKPIKYTKRIGHLFERVTDYENIKSAIRNASKRKTNRPSVQRILKDIDKYALKIQEMLLDENFIPHSYTIREINDGIKQKKRIIAIPRFYPDQCIHHAFVQVFKEIVMHSAFEYSCGCVPGMGTDGARKAIEHWIKTDPAGTSKVAQMDVKKCYPSIKHSCLQKKLEKKIKDKRFLRLAFKIIASFQQPMATGGRLLPETEAVGLPIGLYSSPWFLNFFFEDIDHELAGMSRHNNRYVDDMVLFDTSKRRLHKAIKRVEQYLAEQGMKLKENWQVYKLKDRALDFLGYRFYPDHTSLRKKVMYRISRKARVIAKKAYISVTNACGMLSYLGPIKNTDSHKFWDEWVKPFVNIKTLKGVVSNESRKQFKTRYAV